VADGAALAAQCELLTDISSVEGYCEWMAGLGKSPLEGCAYELHSSSYGEANRTAVFFATFTASHVGEGGPVAKMCKVWNAPWALGELGWV